MEQWRTDPMATDPTATDPRLSMAPADELASRLVTVESFQASIRHADAKAGALFSGLSALLMLATGDLPAARMACRMGTAPRSGLVLCGVMLLAGTVVSAARLAAAIHPRFAGADRDANRFAFPSVARHGYLDGSQVSKQLQEAATLAQLLAGIAVAKHRQVARAVPWLTLAACSALGWATLAGWYGA